eukprot:3048241-Rhodomonas_salina.2
MGEGTTGGSILWWGKTNGFAMTVRVRPRTHAVQPRPAIFASICESALSLVRSPRRNAQTPPPVSCETA